MQNYISGPAGSANQVIVKAQDSWLEFSDGKRVLDAASGAVVANIGYGRKDVVSAVAESLQRTSYVHPSYLTRERIELCELLQADWLPSHIDRLFFACGGGEAIDSAIKVALLYQNAIGHAERTSLLAFRASYHGAVGASLQAGGQRKISSVLRMGRHVREIGNCTCGLEAGSKLCGSCSASCLDSLESEIESTVRHPYAALVAEPMVGTSGGLLLPSLAFWARLQAICRRHGILIVLDEVMTGFGRTGRKFAFEHWGLHPDVIVSGKGLACGYAPICGMFTTAAIMNAIEENEDGIMTGTYSAHPGSCAAAVAALTVVKRERLVSRAHDLGNYLSDALQRLKENPCVVDVRGLGAFWAVEFVQPRSIEKQDDFRQSLINYSESSGVAFYPGGIESCKVVVVIAPPLSIEEAYLPLIPDALQKSIDATRPLWLPLVRS